MTDESSPCYYQESANCRLSKNPDYCFPLNPRSIIIILLFAPSLENNFNSVH